MAASFGLKVIEEPSNCPLDKPLASGPRSCGLRGKVRQNSLDGTRPPACRSADADKYKVTDDGDMKARASGGKTRALVAKTETGLSPGKILCLLVCAYSDRKTSIHPRETPPP
jgi:hypothetical protein